MLLAVGVNSWESEHIQQPPWVFFWGLGMRMIQLGGSIRDDCNI